MRLWAVVKRLCPSSTVEAAVSPDAPSPCPALSPPLRLSLYLSSTFLSSHTPSAFLTFYVLLHHSFPHNISLPPRLPLVTLFHHFLFVDHFGEPEGKSCVTQ